MDKDIYKHAKEHEELYSEDQMQVFMYRAQGMTESEAVANVLRDNIKKHIG